MFQGQRHWLLRSVMSANCQRVSNALGISTSAVRWDNDYYVALGVTPKSTQNEIKAAYYKLSMQYHPDKNRGSDIAAKKFREITQAYEVLGNYRLRRLYDKGIVHTAGAQYAHRYETHYEHEVEDDPETKFYKSRFKKSQVADNEGRTPIYDFDEWSRAHYGKAFQRRKSAKARYDRKEERKQQDIFSIQNELFLFGMVFFVAAMYAIFYAESSLDTPKKRAARQALEEKNEKRES